MSQMLTALAKDLGFYTSPDLGFRPSASGQRFGNKNRSEDNGTPRDTGERGESSVSTPKSSKLANTLRPVRSPRPVIATNLERSTGPAIAT